MKMKIKMNKILAGVLTLLMLVGALCSCVEVKTTDDVDTTRPYVVCTAFPQYDFIKNIASDGVNFFGFQIYLFSSIDSLYARAA